MDEALKKMCLMSVSRWHTLPPEAVFWDLNSDDKNKKTGHGL